MSEIEIFIRWTTLIGLCIAGWNDWKKREIPNWIVYPGMILGLCLNWFAGGSQGLIFSAISLFVVFVFFGIFYLINQIGEGDVKLIMACAALMGVYYTGGILITGGLIGSVYAIFQWFKTLKVKKNKKIQIPFGTFMAIGALIYQICLLCF